MSYRDVSVLVVEPHGPTADAVEAELTSDRAVRFVVHRAASLEVAAGQTFTMPVQAVLVGTSIAHREEIEAVARTSPVPVIALQSNIEDLVALDLVRGGLDDCIAVTEIPGRLGHRILLAIERRRGLDEHAGGDHADRAGVVERFRHLLSAAPSGMMLVDRSGIILMANAAAATCFGYEPGELDGRHIETLIPPRFRPSHPGQMEGFFSDPRPRRMGAGRDLVGLRKSGEEFPAEIGLNPVRTREGLAVVVNVIDATERKVLEDRNQRRLDQLAALHKIDLVITGTLDLHLSLEMILDQTVRQLGADAACILLFDTHLHRLVPAGVRGMRSAAWQKVHVPFGQGYAGECAMERKPVKVLDLRRKEGDGLRAAARQAEEFISYCAVPMVSRGSLKGVLEVMFRSLRHTDALWEEFFVAIGTQAAIAVDVATLIDELRSSRDELQVAYDATIEGWARALELRDVETSGHTARVAELTVRVAHAMGIDAGEIEQMRRGAILHDVGKTAIPDTILLKPGPLTDSERQIMQQHPKHAYEMLQPIRFLKHSLDIPYCHHERWDGKGYPRGLAGESIPLSARIFAVVDVFDALISDRPYRPAMPYEQVIAHIHESAGAHFDPRVVEVFLQTVGRRG